MALALTELPIAGLKLLAPRKLGDERGFFSETYSQRELAAAGFARAFVQDNHSLSAAAGTVRGLHFQAPPHAQAKLVRVVRGAILDVAVDIRKGSPTFGRHVAVELSADNWHQLLVPEGFAHGFCTLKSETEVIYKVTDFYAPQADCGILWDDAALGIAWPAGAGAVVSEKDRRWPRLAEIDSPFAFASPGA